MKIQVCKKIMRMHKYGTGRLCDFPRKQRACSKEAGPSPPATAGGDGFPLVYRPGSQLVARRSSQVCRRTMSPERPSFTRATAGMGLEL